MKIPVGIGSSIDLSIAGEDTLIKSSYGIWILVWNVIFLGKTH